jgi:hypothetical protein
MKEGKMNKKIVLLIGAVVAILAVCVCVIVVIVGLGLAGGVSLTQPIADVGEKFMQSLKVADYNTAFGLCDPSLKTELGSAQGLKKLVDSGKAQPTKWNFTSRNIENNQGHIDGTVTMLGGEGTLSLDFIKVGSDWKVVGFDLKPN